MHGGQVGGQAERALNTLLYKWNWLFNDGGTRGIIMQELAK